MNNRKILVPNASHPIDIQQCDSTVIVSKGDLQIARSAKALTLSEADYPAVQYIPRDDVDMSRLERSTRTTYCPYKGEAHYYNIPALGESGIGSVWTYESPSEAVVAIAGYLAFYPDKVTVEVVG